MKKLTLILLIIVSFACSKSEDYKDVLTDSTWAGKGIELYFTGNQHLNCVTDTTTWFGVYRVYENNSGNYDVLIYRAVSGYDQMPLEFWGTTDNISMTLEDENLLNFKVYKQ